MSETIGVDVGGTKIAVAMLRGGKLGEPSLRPTVEGDAEELLAEIIDAVNGLRTPATEAVGVGVPSVVDFASGRLRSSVNVPFQDLPVRGLLTERLGLPVFVDNDATLAALAEAYEEGRIAVDSLIIFTVGTGVGGGLVLGGKVHRGRTGAAGEVGHTIVGMDLERGAPPPSEFPQAGSLESLAAGRELDRLAEAAAQAEPKSALGRRLAEVGEVSGADAVDAARDGDEAAVDALRILGERLGIGIANAINLLEPEVVVIGGGVSSAGDLILEPARRVAMQYVLDGVGTETEIRLARRGNEAGVLGAALLAAIEHGGI